jgi:predicted signal transduction protein with EAL and GGDEF domain
VTRRFGEELSQWHSPSMEVINYRQDGRPYWIDLKVAPLADADGWYTHWVSVQRDVSDRKADQQLLLDQAYTDPLTGLINRRGLYGLLDQLLAQSSCQIALIFCDLDRFKEVNDRYGHAVGDALLLELTNRLKSELRSHDHLARLGGG